VFSWIAIHREAIRKILEYRKDEKELLTILREMEQKGLKVINLQDKDASGQTIPLAEIDPFTFLASFNRGVTEENRRENWKFLKARWSLKAPVPDDFIGIPTLFNMTSRLIPWAKDKEENHVAQLWQVAGLAAEGGVENIDEELFNRCLKLKCVGIVRLTIGFFWINPAKFLPAEPKTTAYGKAKGITTKPEDYLSYRQWMKEMTEQLGSNYPQTSHAAHLFATQSSNWHFAKWMGPVLDALRALGGSGTPKAVGDKIRQTLGLPDSDITKTNKSGQTKFYNEVAWARKNLVWEGLVDGTQRGVWALTAKGKLKVLDEKEAQSIVEKWAAHHKDSADEEMEDDIGQLHERPTEIAAGAAGVAYWWLNANPKIWDFGALPIGGKETYTSHNDKGNKRRIFQNFLAVKPGDIVLGYVGQPQKEVVAVCRITQGLHQTENGNEIEFEKTESVASPISYDTLQASVDLAKSEPFVNNLQGSLFKLTEQEYEIIRSLIDETNISVKAEIENYDKKKAMKSLFLAEIQFDEMLAALAEKKNVVLQGAPGVGKTYIAKRLAYALIGSNDPQRIEMIQFHQSYSYEDFIQGFRPTPKGHFDLKYGIFHQFCRRAQREEAQGKPYVFIIDEINRGNLRACFKNGQFILTQAV